MRRTNGSARRFSVLLLALGPLWFCGEGSPASTFQPVAPRLAMSGPHTLPRLRDVHQRQPAITYGQETYLVVWQEGFEGWDGKSAILALRIGKDGTPLDKEPLPLCTTDGVREGPVVAFCADKFFVVWSDLRNGTDYDLYGATVTPSGAVIPKDGFLLAGGPGSQAHASISSNGKNEFFVVWQQFVEDHFEVFAKRLDASEPSSKSGAISIMGRGERPVVTWNGTNYAVCQKWYATIVTSEGRKVVPTFQIWKTKSVAWPRAASAWGKAFFFLNTEPYPDPWGWGGNGAIVGVSITATGESPEAKLAERFPDLQAAKADGRVQNCLDAARWRNHPGWPMGMRGGLKGTHDGMWPNGLIAATYNGRSLLCVWPRAHMVDNRRLTNRDLYLTRLVPDWGLVDTPPVKIVSGPTEETNPVLCAGKDGQALLAWEKVTPTGVAIEYRFLVEEEDCDPPKALYVVPQTDTEWVVAFDEPIAPETASRSENFSIEGVSIKTAAFNTDNRGGQREVILTIDPPLTRGKIYTMRISGVCDRSPRHNKAAEQVLQFVAKPGSMLRVNFIDRWLVLGPFPRDVVKHPFDVSTVRPASGQKVGPCEWTVVKRMVLDFGARYGENADQMAYAAVWSFSDRERDAFLWVDSNDHNRIWWNGQIVHDGITGAAATRGFHDYRDEVPVTVKKGWNLLIVQVENRFGAWLMTCQLVDSNGLPLRDLTWQSDPPTET